MAQRAPKMTFKEQQALHKLLSDVLSRDNDQMEFSYVKGWSDQRVAEQFKVNIAVIRRFRMDNFGALKRGTGDMLQNFFGNLQRQIDALEDRVAALEGQPKANGEAEHRLAPHQFL